MAIGKADYLSWKNAESGGTAVEFVTLLKQCLIADTNAQEWPACFDICLGSLKQSLAVERVDAIVECADTRQYHAMAIANLFRSFDEDNIRSNFEQRFMNAAQVSGAIIDQGDHLLTLATDGRG